MKRKIYKLLSSVQQVLFVLALIAMPGLAYSQTFAYTGGQQTVLLPAGPYKIECWGGTAGDGTYYSGASPNSIDGGKGGYSTGTITLNSPTTLYIHCGGRGSNVLAGNNPGGYNGGGNSSSAGYQAGSGGGATHVATAPGVLSSLAGNQAAVLIVAGGGGGGGNQSLGGDGGGLNGVTCPIATQFSNRTPGGGGTQNTGGACYTSGFGAGFGQGGTTTQNLAGGGGGGWYGGCSGDNSTGGGGGSGYIGGVSSGTTAAYNTPGFLPNPDITGNGRVIITLLCNISLNSTAANNQICIGQSITLSTDASNVTWTGGSTSSSIVVSPQVTTSYSVTGTSTANCTTQRVITVTVNPLPTISAIVTPTTLCVGQSATIVANGAATYTWNNGPTGAALIVSPGVTTSYNLAASSIYGCLNSAVIPVNVNTNSISVTPAVSLCKGSALTLTASGAVTYTWSSGSNFAVAPVSPNASTTYTVEGIDAFGCKLSSMVPVTVNSTPTITANASKPNPCKNEPVTLTASGSVNTYTWSNNTTGPVTSINTAVDVVYTYTVTGEDNNGCKATAIVTVSVNKCVGINEFGKAGLEAKVYPNPVGNTLTVELNNGSNKVIEVTDMSGRLILSKSGNTEAIEVNVTGLANGVYYVKLRSDNMTEVFKIVKGN